MSPRLFTTQPTESVAAGVQRLWSTVGLKIRDARQAKRWSVGELARRAGVSVAVAYRAEAGNPTSLEALTRLATSLGLRLELEVVDPRRRERPPRQADIVHSGMGELEAAHLRRLGYRVGLDEPYQHYQFAGRADLLAWHAERRILLHIENRTRFPDFQEMAGAYNAKRAYLGAALVERLGLRGGWRSETHVIAALWSSEVLRTLRLRTESFRALCPNQADALAAWWSGNPPPAGTSSCLIVLDPSARGRQRPWLGLEDALAARPRHRGYADAAASLEA
jgi:transcriptional regulator with XRE-family HTH domain